jgi:hypothetical protein
MPSGQRAATRPHLLHLLAMDFQEVVHSALAGNVPQPCNAIHAIVTIAAVTEDDKHKVLQPFFQTRTAEK